MSFTPYDWEDEERRDSERFATFYDDTPDPREYMDYPDELDEDAMREMDDPTTYTESQQAAIREGYDPDDDIWMLRGCLGILVALLLGFMVWIIGAGIWWVL